MAGPKTITVILTALLTAAAMAGAEPTTDGVTVKLSYAPCAGREMFSSGTQVRLSPQKPNGLTAEPKYTGKPLYGSVALGPKAKALLAVLDGTGGPGNVQGSLYIDRDGDGDLAEETAVTLGQGGGDLHITVTTGGKSIKRMFSARAYGAGDAGAMLILQERGAWQAKARVNGVALDIMLADGNGNGVFNDAFRMPEPGKPMTRPPDMFLTKPMAPPVPDFGGICVNPAMLTLGGKLYNATVAADGSSITFTPFPGKTATLTAPDGMAAILWVGDRMLTVTARDGKLLVPAGTIRKFAYACRAKDAKGVEWALMANPDFEAKPIELPPGASKPFPGGLPVQVSVKADATGKVAAGGTVKFTATITDAAGGDIRIEPIPGEDDPAERPPTVIMISSGRKELVRGKCGFG